MFKTLGLITVLLLSNTTQSRAQTTQAPCAQIGLGEMQKGLYEAAILSFTTCLNSNPNNASLYFQRGTCYLLLKKASIALVDFNQSLAIDSSFLESYYNRGLAHQALKNFTFSEADFIYYYSRVKKDDKVLRNLALLMEDMGDYPSAIKYYSQFLNLHPDDHGVRQARALIFAEIDSVDAAINDINICLKPLANDTGVWMCKGNICYDAMRYMDAIDAYNVVLLLDSNNKTALINRADAFTASAQYIEAIDDYLKLSRNDKYNPAYYFNIGFCYLQLNENEKAILSFGKALDTDFEPLGMLLTFRGVAYHNLKLQAEACSDWQKAVLSGYDEASKYRLNYCK